MIRIIFTCCFVFLYAVTCNADDPSTKDVELLESFKKLKRLDGLLLLDVDAAGIAPSIEIHRVYNQFLAGKITLSLKDLQQRYVFYALPEGDYQITRVNAPYFDLPYKVNTLKDDAWRFTIKRNRLNYIGRLVIHETRTRHANDIALINRYAEQYNDILRQFPLLTTEFPLVLSSYYQDDFDKEFNSEDK